MLHRHLEVTNQGVVSGLGLVARSPISSGELVWRPDSSFPFLSYEELRVLRASGNTDHYSQVDAGSYARNSSKEWRFNHSCSPNCYAKGGQIYAARDIAEGAEVLYDYSLTEIGLRFEFVCACNSSLCRTVVTNLDYLDPELIDRSKAWTPDYVLAAAERASPKDRVFYSLSRRARMKMRSDH